MKRNELLIAFVVVLISLSGVIYSLSLPQGVSNNGVLRAGVFPLVVTSILLICSLLLIVQSVRDLKGDKKKWSGILDYLLNIGKQKAFWMMVAIFLYFMLVSVLGFFTGTLILLFIVLYLVFKHKIIFSLVVAISFSFASFYIFQSLLGVNLPSGFFL